MWRRFKSLTVDAALIRPRRERGDAPDEGPVEEGADQHCQMEQLVRMDDAVDGLATRAAHPNVVLFRTFSKAYGLAGLRLGFGIAANTGLISPLINLKPTWNLGQMQIAAGIAAIGVRSIRAATTARAR